MYCKVCEFLNSNSEEFMDTENWNKSDKITNTLNDNKKKGNESASRKIIDICEGREICMFERNV